MGGVGFPQPSASQLLLLLLFIAAQKLYSQNFQT
jgi:hypothetical protein